MYQYQLVDKWKKNECTCTVNQQRPINQCHEHKAITDAIRAMKINRAFRGEGRQEGGGRGKRYSAKSS